MCSIMCMCTQYLTIDSKSITRSILYAGIIHNCKDAHFFKTNSSYTLLNTSSLPL